MLLELWTTGFELDDWTSELDEAISELEELASELELALSIAELELAPFVVVLELEFEASNTGDVELLSQAFQKNAVKASKNFFQDLFIMLFYSQKIASHTSLIYLFQ